MLLIRLSALGDVVLVSVAIRALRTAQPGLRIDLVTDARYVAFAEAHLGADRVIGYDRHGADAGWAGVRRVQARLPEPRYDAVVDLQGKLRTRALARRIPATHHLVLQKRSPGRAALALLGHDPPRVGQPAAALYVDVLAPLGVSAPVPLETRLEPPSARRHGDGRLRIGLSVGASHATKRWAPARFAALALALREARPEASFSLVGGPSDAEDLDALQAALPPELLDPVDARRLDVAGLAAHIAGLDLMVSVDSGPAHLSAGFGVPTVVLFGPTASSRWGPVGAAHAVVQLGLDCAPCSNTGGSSCPRSDRAHACMRHLEVQDVLPVALAALERSGR